MNTKLKKNYLFLKWFFIIIIVEFAILVLSIYSDFFLLKLMINYLFLAGLIPFIFERINKGRIDIFSPLAVFTFFYLLLFGIRAIDMLIFSPEQIEADLKFYQLAIFYAIVGLHFFQVGYFFYISKKNSTGEKSSKGLWLPFKFKIILIGYSVISVFSFLIIVQLSGGLSTYFRNIRDSMVNITSGSTVFFMLVLLIQIPLLIFFCYVVQYKKQRIALFLYFIFVSVLLISLGERGHFVTLLISMMVCYHYLKKKIPFFAVTVSTLVIIAFLVLFGQYRDFTQEKDKSAKLELSLGLITTYHYFIGHFDQLRHVKDVVKSVPDELNFQYGKTYLNFLVKPIPSKIWKEKPQGAGRVITKSIYPKANVLGVTVAPSIIAELYLNFHIIGIICGMFLFGLISRSLYSYLINNKKNINTIIIYAICFPYFFSELRGDFTVVTSFLIFKLFFLFIALHFINLKDRQQATESV